MWDQLWPFESVGESRVLPKSSLVTVCSAESALVHVTVVPTCTVSGSGLNVKLLISTLAVRGVCAGVGVGVCDGGGVGVAAGVIAGVSDGVRMGVGVATGVWVEVGGVAGGGVGVP